MIVLFPMIKGNPFPYAEIQINPEYMQPCPDCSYQMNGIVIVEGCDFNHTLHIHQTHEHQQPNEKIISIYCVPSGKSW